MEALSKRVGSSIVIGRVPISHQVEPIFLSSDYPTRSEDMVHDLRARRCFRKDTLSPSFCHTTRIPELRGCAPECRCTFR